MAFNWEWNVERRAGRGPSLKSEECYFFFFLLLFILHSGYFNHASPCLAVWSSVNKVCPQGPEAMRSDSDPLFSETVPGMALWLCRRSPSPTEDCGWRPWMARSRWGTLPAFPGKPASCCRLCNFLFYFILFFSKAVGAARVPPPPPPQPNPPLLLVGPGHFKKLWPHQLKIGRSTRSSCYINKYTKIPEAKKTVS